MPILMPTETFIVARAIVRRLASATALSVVLAACSVQEPDPDPSTRVQEVLEPARPAEAELSTVRLPQVSIDRLGLRTGVVEPMLGGRTRDVGGIVTVPPGRAVTITAPLAGTLGPGSADLQAGRAVSTGDVLLRLVPFAPADRDLQAQAQRQRASTRARLELTQARLERTRKLLEQRGASQRALEEAQADLATAQAEDDAAAARARALRRSPLAADATLAITAPADGILRLVSATPGQRVAAGSPLFEVAGIDSLWVRVPVYPAELAQLALTQPIRVTRLGQDPSQGDEALPVLAPPSASAVGLTVDLFYLLPADGVSFRPDERVVARLPYAADEVQRRVPASAVVLDFDGGTWVYECLDATSFHRRRVEIVRQDQTKAVLRRGPAAGTCIVTVGALELLGAELGVAH